MNNITLRDLTNCLMVMGGDETRNAPEMTTLATQLAGQITISGNKDKLNGLKEMMKSCENMIAELQTTTGHFKAEIESVEQQQ